jgi:hypothetical protein
MIVFVGRREGALAAAQKLGVDVVLVVERAPRHTPPVVRGVIECDFTSEDSTAVARRVRTLGEPRAVLALTEAAVMPAARLRSQLGVPGLQPEHALLCTDKRAMKRAATAVGLRCARFVEAGDGLSAAQIVERLGLPLVVKPARSSGGRGTRRIDAPADVPSVLPDGHLAESWVEGVEMSVESLVQGGAPVFVNVTEYFEPRWANLVPAVLPEAERAALLDLNLRVIRALGVERGMTHVEAFLTRDGFVFGELAVRPPGGHLMELLQIVYGFDPWIACIELEHGRAAQVQAGPRCFSGVRVLHPGAGTVDRIVGVEEIESLPQLVRFACRVQPGDVISERVGAGQEVGYVVFASRRREEVVAGLERARRSVRFDMRS